MLRVMLWCTVCAWREERGRGWTLCENRRERTVLVCGVCVWLRWCG